MVLLSGGGGWPRDIFICYKVGGEHSLATLRDIKGECSLVSVCQFPQCRLFIWDIKLDIHPPTSGPVALQNWLPYEEGTIIIMINVDVPSLDSDSKDVVSKQCFKNLNFALHDVKKRTTAQLPSKSKTPTYAPKVVHPYPKRRCQYVQSLIPEFS